MKPKLPEQLDEITGSFRKEFGHLDVGELNWKPTLKTWSIAQNIDHLILINQSYLPVINKLRSGEYKPPVLSRFRFMVRLTGNMILNAIGPDRKRKMKTFSIWEPAQSDLPADILTRFETHQTELKRLIEDSRDLVEGKFVISSPANRHVVYYLGTAFEIMVTHEKRHLEQCRELLTKLKEDNST